MDAYAITINPLLFCDKNKVEIQTQLCDVGEVRRRTDPDRVHGLGIADGAAAGTLVRHAVHVDDYLLVVELHLARLLQLQQLLERHDGQLDAVAPISAKDKNLENS
jgi:hypothetical protein